MIKVLALDSSYMISPLRKLYIALIGRMLNAKNTNDNSLILYRLDQNNIFIRNEGNISGNTIGVHKDDIEALSIEFYRYLEELRGCKTLSMKNVQLYNLYTRQVKLKLASILKCAFRIKNLSIYSKEKLEIKTDRQTASIMNDAFLFLNFEPTNIRWQINGYLTSCITVNALIMRFFAIIKTLITPSKLPKNYLHKHVNDNYPTVLITMPKRRPSDFFSTYIEEFGSEFNIILYSLGFMRKVPNDYTRVKIKSRKGIFRGIFNIQNICFTSESYIADILLIYKDHANLSPSIDVVNSIFENKIDAHVSRLQTSVVDNYLAIKARERGVFILGDVFEEVYYCDSAVCSSESENTNALNLALIKGGEVAYKGNNSLIRYRLKNFDDNQFGYIHKLLKADLNKKIIFYASDPSKEESQRYLTEKFLINCFSRRKDFILVIKTHPQDNGKITEYAYLDAEKPLNVILIGDIAQKSKIASKQFMLFHDFDFNAAIISSDGFLTFSSSSILQALTLGVKTGIVDKFNNGFYDYLISYKASMLINSEESLQDFLGSQKLDISDNILRYCGLKNNTQEFDVGKHLLNCLGEVS